MTGRQLPNLRKGTTFDSIIYIRKALLNKIRSRFVLIEHYLLNIFWDGLESNNFLWVQLYIPLEI